MHRRPWLNWFGKSVDQRAVTRRRRLACESLESRYVLTAELDFLMTLPLATQTPEAVVRDASDNVYIGGTFRGVVDFDPSANTAMRTSNGGNDVFIACYDTAGQLRWVNTFGTFGDDIFGGLDIDNGGFNYATWSYQGTIDVGVNQFISRGGYDIINAQLDAGGLVQWSQSIGDVADDISSGLDFVPTTSQVLVTGTFQGTVDFDASMNVSNRTSNGVADVFAMTLTNFGSLVWVASVGGPLNETAGGIIGGSDGSVYVTGTFQGTADFDPGVGVVNRTSDSASIDIFALKLTSTGAFGWVSAMGGPFADFGEDLALNNTGSLVVTGEFTGRADFDDTTAIAELIGNNTTTTDAYLVVLGTADGRFELAQGWGGSDNDTAVTVAVAADNSYYVGGAFRQTADMDPGPDVAQAISKGSTDFYYNHLSSSGTFLTFRAGGGTGTDSLDDLTFANDGKLITVGRFQNTVNFEISTDGVTNVTAASTTDGFLARYFVPVTLPRVSFLNLLHSQGTSNPFTNIIVTLSNPSPDTITIPFTIGGTATLGEDYTLSASNSITIFAGSTSGSIDVSLITGGSMEPDETIILTLGDIVGGIRGRFDQTTDVIRNGDGFGIFLSTAGAITVYSTGSDDSVTLNFATPNTLAVTVNGNTQNASLAGINNVFFNDNGGTDTVVVVLGSTSTDSVVLTPKVIRATGSGPTLYLSKTEFNYIFGNTTDSAQFYDSDAVDALYQLPAYSLMTDATNTYVNEIIGFGQSTGTAIYGGNDFALLYGTSGIDQYFGNATESHMLGGGVQLDAIKFESNYSFGLGGNDIAGLTGSVGNDLFTGVSTYSVLSMPNAIVQFPIGFPTVTVTGSLGTDITALYDTLANETFVTTPLVATLTGVGFSYIATNFDQNFAIAQGGTDTATFNDSLGNDVFYSFVNIAALQGTNYFVETIGYDTVDAIGTQGFDVAMWFDSPGNDNIFASGPLARFTYSGGAIVRSTAFDLVQANRTVGVDTSNVVLPIDFVLQLNGGWI